jgi:hypothetical protein
MEYTGSCPHPTPGVRGPGYSPMMWNGNIPPVSKETFSSHTPLRQLPPQSDKVQLGGNVNIGNNSPTFFTKDNSDHWFQARWILLRAQIILTIHLNQLHLTTIIRDSCLVFLFRIMPNLFQKMLLIKLNIFQINVLSSTLLTLNNITVVWWHSIIMAEERAQVQCSKE